MTWDVWILYVATLAAYMSAPGPSHLLMLSNSMAHGFPRSTATAMGDLTANALQMLAAGFGLAALIMASPHAVTVIKWAGVAYLLWLGLRMWRQGKNATAGASAPTASFKTLWLQGFLTSASNPKAIVFFTALFPQFIDMSAPFAMQFFILSVTYIIVDGCFLCGFGISADWVAKKLQGRANLWLDRIGAACLVGAAVLLSLKGLTR